MDQRVDDSQYLWKEPCPACGSRDNLARYSDGHGFCFGCQHHEKGEGAVSTPHTTPAKVLDLCPPGSLNYGPLVKRRLSEETCRHWRYGTTQYNDKPCQVATYFDSSGHPVCQKLRFPDKTFKMIGDTSSIPLFGQQLARDGGKMIIVTEGEIDAMSVSQAQGLKWPAVSIPNGASGAAKSIRTNIEFLEKYERVVFMFDMDEPGQAAALECAELLSPGKGFIAQLPLKDANEMVQAGRGSEIISAAWGAKAFRPDGIVSVDALIEEAKKPIEWGLPWFLPTLNQATYGRRFTEIYMLGAGTGVGKTDFLTQQIEYDVNTLKEKVGVLMLEQKPVETVKRIAGKAVGKRFHVPDGSWEQSDLEVALEDLRDKILFYDSFGQTEWDTVKAKIRYMSVSEGIRIFYLDHLTAMADTSRERESIEQIMKEMSGLANELSIIIHCVSHLSTPEGKPHEEGGRVQIKNFKGSRSIGFWSFFMFGLERNQQADDVAERQVTTFRILKDRYTGQATGTTISLGYTVETGTIYEQDSTFCAATAEEADEYNEF